MFTSSAFAAQPRVRGERLSAAALMISIIGSAPRARGTGDPVGAVRVGSRLSPACAGNGLGSSNSPSCSPAQPRVRGERAVLLTRQREITGSAPRARGTELDPAKECARSRLSPACAGNGGHRRVADPRRSAQPRGRGERRPPDRSKSRDAGSAPRARGTGGRRHDRGGSRRLSPACAGNGFASGR